MGKVKLGSGFDRIMKSSEGVFKANVQFASSKVTSRGIPKHKNQIMRFDYNAYLNDLRQSLKKATNEIRDLLIYEMKDRVRSLPFKANEVKLAGGKTTSDLDRRYALIDSIRAGYTEWQENNVLKAVVRAMDTDFSESHIGWYYEIGTGEKSDLSLYNKYGFSESLGDSNPYRIPKVGSPIVSRDRKDGYWRDLGGNLRETSSSVGGIGNQNPPTGKDGKPIMDQDRYREVVERFRTYIGEDIEAYRWFEKSVEAVRKDIIDIYKKAVARVPISNYIYVQDMKW